MRVIIGAAIATLLLVIGFATVGQPRERTLAAIWAHADDETPVGPVLARYAREGVKVYSIIVTDSARGVANTSVPPGPELADIRADEARCAARALGIEQPILLGFPDGALGDTQADPSLLFRVTQRLHEELQRIRPDVLVTWGPEGGYGHADHRMVSSLVSQLARAGAPAVPQRVFYASIPIEGLRAMNPARGEPPLLIPQASLFTTRVAFSEEDFGAARKALACHATQLSTDAMDRVMTAMADAWSGELPLSPMVPLARSNDLFW